jgi:hypothetical protein
VVAFLRRWSGWGDSNPLSPVPGTGAMPFGFSPIKLVGWFSSGSALPPCNTGGRQIAGTPDIFYSSDCAAALRRTNGFLMLDSPSEVLNGAQRTLLRANRVQRIGKSAFYLHVLRAGTVEIRKDAAQKRFKTNNTPASGSFLLHTNLTDAAFRC